jgi:TRAP-type uncharacterized transport system substrate-binding protein
LGVYQFHEKKEGFKMKRISIFVMTVFLAVLLTFSGFAFGAEVKDLVLMSSVVGGIGYQYSMGVNKVIQKVLPDVRTTMEATAGYVDNAKRLYAGYGHLGIVSLDTAKEMIAHKGEFAKQGTTILALVPIHKLEWNIIVHADGPFKGIRDLDGNGSISNPREVLQKRPGHPSSTLWGSTFSLPITAIPKQQTE